MLSKLFKTLKTEQDISDLQARAEAGDPVAITLIGVCYAGGKIFKTDKDQHRVAAEYYLKAAEAGYSQAQLALGVCYYTGRGVALDNDLGFKWCTLAANQGDPHAHFNLGQSYQYARGVAYDSDKAMEHYKAAVQGFEGSENAFTQLKYHCAEIMVTYDHQEAYDMAFKLCAEAKPTDEYFSKAVDLVVDHALKGSLKATEFLLALSRIQISLQMTTAVLLMNQNQPQKAIEFLEMAAKNGISESQLVLAILHRRGSHVEKDLIKAKNYYLQAARDGKLAGAQYLLGLFFIFEEKNYALGQAYLQKAADQGLDEAAKILKFLNSTASRIDKLPAQVFSNDVDIKLGDAYESAQDYVMAEFHYRLAIEEEHSEVALEKLLALYSLEPQASIAEMEKPPVIVSEIESVKTKNIVAGDAEGDATNSFRANKIEFGKEDEEASDSEFLKDGIFSEEEDSDERSDEKMSSMEAKLALTSFNSLWATTEYPKPDTARTPHRRPDVLLPK